ncbi:tyrosine-protein phosphatase [Glaciihabitans sp. INWT7]|uniref:tyrosine-protein phosphatase n=1 Tax=Glaciihabitans sp. INWT7 TaxID=2596912 RepID=UPI00162573D5|nr:tyrosine-protein phosphatase [Glaciihabitans sp. INWT7]QNE47092.1 tyrosine-protein phosphatase [Glaciihabitans sp. INWT7]
MTTLPTAGRPYWPGSFNLADVGGLPLRSGGVTRSGRVFRSARPDYLTPEGWRAARAAGVTTVVDLRNPGESTSEGTVPATGAAAGSAVVPEGIRCVSCPTEDPTDPQFLALCGALLDHPLSYADNIRLYPRKFAEVFRAIAAAEGAVLVHCAAGRDRTGMVMAILLSVVGVIPEAIADDYVDAAVRFNAGLGREPGLTEEKAHSAAVMEERIASRRSALLAWLESLDVESYLRASGLSSGEIDLLRQRLL